MKKIFKQIRLRYFGGRKIDSCRQLCGFVVLYRNGTYQKVYDKEDLVDLLEKDITGKVWYVFNMADRIILSKDIVVTSENGMGGEIFKDE